MLDGRAYLVTGGSMGIGRACAEAILDAGGSVVVAARGQAALEDAERALAVRASVARVSAVAADVTADGAVEGLIREVTRRFGRFDGLVHAAGIYGPIGPMASVDPHEWFDAIRVNLHGSFLALRAAAAHSIAAGSPLSVVLFSGGGAATPFPNYTAYACGKAGVVRLTETAAIELSHQRVRVNCIAPGFVITRLHQQTLEAGTELAGDFVEKTRAQIESGGVPPTVAARCAVFLLSDRAEGITGRFVAAPYDGYEAWPERLTRIAGSDLFTLRRIVPKDRGEDWQ